jgi:hypothetical protein
MEKEKAKCRIYRKREQFRVRISNSFFKEGRRPILSSQLETSLFTMATFCFSIVTASIKGSDLKLPL